ncbi:MAG: inorganic phosphate transporter, partial [Thiovulaceae bacterium]|nr:inorganic phosphate transporter [Sulfurimonadaceae bacterium]
KVWPDIVELLPFLPETKKPTLSVALTFGAIAAVISFYFMNKSVREKASELSNTRESINTLFTIPLIFAAALLSFAHGANDVANAVGPLAAINDAITHGGVSKKVDIPLWVMLIGAVGISVGLALYGPKLIRTVGSEITELDRMRAFAIAMAAAITVIIASQLKLPVSSTHIAVGGVFGVGLLREFLQRLDVNDSDTHTLATMKEAHEGVEDFIKRFNTAPKAEQEAIIKAVKNKKSTINSELQLSKKERKLLRKLFKQELVKRSAMSKIIAAWLITVPASATLAALLFFMIRGFMLP